MILIIGGKFHGKYEFLKKYFKEDQILDCEKNFCDNFSSYKVIYNVHHILNDEVNNMNFENKVVVGDEIGIGIVPIEFSDRKKRDEVGRFYQRLGKNADVVIRIWYGIPIYIKGSVEIFERKVLNEK